MTKEREVVANWIMNKGFATGHGDSIVDMLDELEWQVAEKERERIFEIVKEGLWDGAGIQHYLKKGNKND